MPENAERHDGQIPSNAPASILYVCTFWGVRSLIAEALTRRLAGSGVHVDSAGFEHRKIGEFPRGLMRERGHELPAESPETVFQRARSKRRYDYVVMLYDSARLTHDRVMVDAVERLFAGRATILHWDASDFKSIVSMGDGRRAAAHEIVDRIETRVRALLLECGRLAAETAGEPAGR